ncbi:MAG: zinc ribbon domain-containing protein [Lachnospiraceae bacterium]|nr:zinc ribbon domain-containing protein [Lachnospiraceae bacterium]
MKKIIILPAILLVFYLTIFSIITFGIIKFQNHDHFVIALIFELIGFILLALVAVMNMIVNPPVKTGFFAPLTLITLFYTVFLHILNIGLVQLMPSIWGVLLNLILLFVYLTIAGLMVFAGRMDTRPHSGVLTQHVIGREARQEGTRECPHCNVMIPYSVEFCPVCGKPSSPPQPPIPPVSQPLTPPASATFGRPVQVASGDPGMPGSAYAPVTPPPAPVTPPPAPAPSGAGSAPLVCACGAPLLMGSKFCPNCGRSVG